MHAASHKLSPEANSKPHQTLANELVVAKERMSACITTTDKPMSQGHAPDAIYLNGVGVWVSVSL